MATEDTFDDFEETFKSTVLTRRHYKKDSRFVFDLYTLCYDENESVDTVELFTSIVNNTAGNWKEEVPTYTLLNFRLIYEMF